MGLKLVGVIAGVSWLAGTLGHLPDALSLLHTESISALLGGTALVVAGTMLKPR